MAAELVRQFVFLAGILAGFSLGVVAQLATVRSSRHSSSQTLSLMIVASTLSFACVTIGSIVLILMAGPLSTRTALTAATLTMLVLALFLLALITFLAGLAFAGFMHSRRVGIIASSASILAFALIVLFGLVSIRTL